MTTVTATRQGVRQVPVPTELAKAILGYTFAYPLTGLYEALDPVGMGGADSLDHWIVDGADSVLDSYVAAMQKIRGHEALLLSLRDVVPGKDAAVQVPDDFGLLFALDETISHLVEEDVSKLTSPRWSQRQVAEATVAAIDYQQTILALYDRDGGA